MEKTKITRKELDDIYDVIPDIEDSKNIPEKETDKNFSFEEYTEQYDKEDKKVEEDAN